MSKINPFKNLPAIVRKQRDPKPNEKLEVFWELKMQLLEIGKGYVKELERHQTATNEQKSEVSDSQFIYKLQSLHNYFCNILQFQQL